MRDQLRRSDILIWSVGYIALLGSDRVGLASEAALHGQQSGQSLTNQALEPRSEIA